MFNVVDIRHLDFSLPHRTASDVTLGDLHANPMLLIYNLHRYGALAIDQAAYDEMFCVYETLAKSPWQSKKTTLDLVSRFIELIQQMTFIPSTKVFRLIGDELADRGVCDLFMIMLFKLMKQNGIKYKIILSNHGLCFLSAFVTLKTTGRIIQDFCMIHHSAINSFLNFKKLYEWDFINLGQISLDLDEVYLPFLTLVDMSFETSTETINIYSHAAIGINDLRVLAKDFNTTWSDATLQQISQSIYAIKHKFQNEKLTYLLNLFQQSASTIQEKIALGLKPELHPELISMQSSRFWKFCWNRDYAPDVIFRPQDYGNYQVRYFYGHDSSFEKEELPHCICLDGNLGKFGQSLKTNEWMMMTYSPLKAYPQNVIDYETYFGQQVLVKPNHAFNLPWNSIIPCLGIVALGLYWQQQPAQRVNYGFISSIFRHMGNMFIQTPMMVPELTKRR
jgi:hypothetical protein